MSVKVTADLIIFSDSHHLLLLLSIVYQIAIAEYPILLNASEIVLAETASLSIVKSFMGVVVSTVQLSSPTNSFSVFVTFALQLSQLIFVLKSLFSILSFLINRKDDPF